jgi:hypothetical protein
MREDDRTAKDFAGAAMVVEPHAAKSLLHLKFAVDISAISCRKRAEDSHRLRPIDAVDGKDELSHLGAAAIGSE